MRVVASRHTRTHWKDIALYGPDNKPYSDADYTKTADLVEAIYDSICDGKHPDGPLGPALRAAVDAALADGRLTAKQYQIAKWYLDASVQGDVAEEIDRIGIAPLSTNQGLPGGDVAFPRGYGAVPAELAAGLDVRLGAKVSAIDYSGADIVLQTANGKLTAPQVVVTVPVGVMNAGTGPTFTPALPATKTAAQHRIGMGCSIASRCNSTKPFGPTATCSVLTTTTAFRCSYI